jgi:CDP-4-dehydro-6-deoxyglucose reductase
VVELRLRPVGQPIRYWPGQYVTIGNPRADIPARAYSISNAPRPDGELVLQVARADGGVTSNWIHDQLAIGESVKVSGAYGTFIGDPAWTPRCCASPPAPASPPSWPWPKPPCAAASASR